MNSILEIKNLSFGYTKDKLVLEDLNIQFNEGEIIALLGKNGCGKSTLLDCIIGANQYQGFVFVDGINSKEYSEKELTKKIAYIPQNLIINIDYSVRDFISFGRNPYKGLFENLSNEEYEMIESNAKVCGVYDLLDNDITKISGGERQLVFIARALTQDSKIIVMDEPLSALDFGNQQRLFRLLLELKRKGKTIIFTTHNPNHLTEINAAIYAMKNGTINKIEELTVDSLNDIYDDEFALKDGYFNFKI